MLKGSSQSMGRCGWSGRLLSCCVWSSSAVNLRVAVAPGLTGSIIHRRHCASSTHCRRSCQNSCNTIYHNYSIWTSPVYSCFSFSRPLSTASRVAMSFACDGGKDSACLVLNLLASCVSIADRSGGIVRSIMSAGNLGIVDKGVNDLQTEADRSVQRCVMASLNKLFPNVAVVGEEDQHQEASVDAEWIETSQSADVLAHAANIPTTIRSIKDSEICVWVDPLDGTAEYTQGLLDHVTVLIGIAVNGMAIAGVIHQPYFNYTSKEPAAQLGRTIWGLVGLGSFGFELKSPDPAQRIVVTTRSHETDAVRNAIAACQPTQVLRVGGAGHKVLLLIEGKAHAYIFASPGCKKRDTCAPEAVLHAIGGTLTDVHGNQYHYAPTVRHQNTGGVLATATGQPHDWYLGKIPDEVKSSLPVE